MRWVRAAIRVLMIGLAVIGLCDYLYGEMEHKGIEDDDEMLVDTYIPIFSAALVMLFYFFLSLAFDHRVPKEHGKYARFHGPMMTCIILGGLLSLVMVVVLDRAEVQPEWLPFAVGAAVFAMSSVAATEWTLLDYRIRKERGEFG